MTEVLACPVRHDDLPRYSRPVPDEWPELVDYAREQIGDTPPDEMIAEQTARNIVRNTGRLDNERFEVVRYYNLGLPIPGMTRALQDPMIRRWAVVGAASVTCGKLIGMNSKHYIAYGKPLHGWTMQDIELGEAFDEAADAGLAGMDRAELAVGDAFRIALAMRRKARDNSGKELRMPPRWQEEFEIGTGRMLREAVTNNLTTGPAHVIEHALKYKIDAEMSKPGAKPRERVSAATFEGLDLETFAKHAASLRADEATVQLPEYTDDDADGNIKFVRSRVLRQLPPPYDPLNPNINDPLHTGRMICPALQVEGLIRLGLSIVPEIVLATQAMLDSSAGKRRGKKSELKYVFA